MLCFSGPHWHGHWDAAVARWVKVHGNIQTLKFNIKTAATFWPTPWTTHWESGTPGPSVPGRGASRSSLDTITTSRRIFCTAPGALTELWWQLAALTGMCTCGTPTQGKLSTNYRDIWEALMMLISTRSSRSYSALGQTSRFIWENLNLEWSLDKWKYLSLERCNVILSEASNYCMFRRN